MDVEWLFEENARTIMCMGVIESRKQQTGSSIDK